ncbi:hypothetical protein MTBSS4_270033 [Magnetospirillum sp. SS-4]|nr:hypothetical protein MTBSS4_270033 [Magnetospirillum sp. SS-4]
MTSGGQTLVWSTPTTDPPLPRAKTISVREPPITTSRTVSAAMAGPVPATLSRAARMTWPMVLVMCVPPSEIGAKAEDHAAARLVGFVGIGLVGQIGEVEQVEPQVVAAHVGPERGVEGPPCPHLGQADGSGGAGRLAQFVGARTAAHVEIGPAGRAVPQVAFVAQADAAADGGDAGHAAAGRPEEVFAPDPVAGGVGGQSQTGDPVLDRQFHAGAFGLVEIDVGGFRTGRAGAGGGAVHRARQRGDVIAGLGPEQRRIQRQPAGAVPYPEFPVVGGFRLQVGVGTHRRRGAEIRPGEPLDQGGIDITLGKTGAQHRRRDSRVHQRGAGDGGIGRMRPGLVAGVVGLQGIQGRVDPVLAGAEHDGEIGGQLPGVLGVDRHRFHVGFHVGVAADRRAEGDAAAADAGHGFVQVVAQILEPGDQQVIGVRRPVHLGGQAHGGLGVLVAVLVIVVGGGGRGGDGGAGGHLLGEQAIDGLIVGVDVKPGDPVAGAGEVVVERDPLQVALGHVQLELAEGRADGRRRRGGTAGQLVAVDPQGYLVISGPVGQIARYALVVRVGVGQVAVGSVAVALLGAADEQPVVPVAQIAPHQGVGGIAAGRRYERTAGAALERLVAPLLGDDVDDAADRLGAVEHGMGATNHLDPLDQGRIDQDRRAVGGVVGDFLPVDQHRAPPGFLAADLDALHAGQRRFVDGESGHVAQHVGNVRCVGALDLPLAHHRDADGTFHNRGFGPGGRDHQGIQHHGIAALRRGLLCRRDRGHAGGGGAGDAQGAFPIHRHLQTPFINASDSHLHRWGRGSQVFFMHYSLCQEGSIKGEMVYLFEL